MNPSQPGVLALISDLAIQSQVTAAAVRAGVPLEVAGTADALVAKLQPGAANRVIIDLSHPGLDTAEFVSRLLAVEPSTRILAFGPHVHKGKLEAARAAGCETVLSRGEFHARMDALLRAMIE
jgi:DNA-binding NarL/FixJ family response regulator